MTVLTSTVRTVLVSYLYLSVAFAAPAQTQRANMATTIVQQPIALSDLSRVAPESHASSFPIERRPLTQEEANDEPREGQYTVTTVPDGGYGWVIVGCAFITTFCHNGIINCWGVLQAALLDSTLKHVEPSTLSYVGTMALAGSSLYCLLAVRLVRQIGCRPTIMLGVFLMGMSLVGASFCTSNLAGLFGTAGLTGVVGMSMVFAVTSALPPQYFSARLGLANGLIKLGGGVGGCVMAIALNAMNQRVGIAWTFRIQGLMTLAIGLPAAWMLKDRVRARNTPFTDFSMLRSIPFLSVAIASAIGVFALFVPPYYLPLFAQSIGLSSGTGAGLVAAFNACSIRFRIHGFLTDTGPGNAIGRFIAGPLCDKLGPLNTFVITMVINAVSMLAIWPVSDTLGPLLVFATVNGVANGAYFTVQPTVVAEIFGPGRASVATGMAITGCTGGYLLGSPIAGYLLQASSGKQGGGTSQSIEVYRPAIFYAGGTATLSALFVLAARLTATKDLRKRV